MTPQGFEKCSGAIGGSSEYHFVLSTWYLAAKQSLDFPFFVCRFSFSISKTLGRSGANQTTNEKWQTKNGK
jgi:hypothetical protein